ncbi:MAG: aminotransferase class I/II-fold pyridoxal phosphate-dependent enzyme [Deltaproteobacteria bacterium]|nr:MAG: aminotransferase class I/II-fold pyridoxal phosphate-dependent enzyme [Deltaproteobacteria bacterium]
MMTEARKRGEDIINLGMGNPDIATPPHIVAKLKEAASKEKNHRYSVSRGLPKLRMAMCNWYKRNYGVELDFDYEAIATIGAKESISHLMYAATGPGDLVLVPNPTYPIHTYAAVIAGADVKPIRFESEEQFLHDATSLLKEFGKRIKFLIISFPSNPTAQIVGLSFFEKVVQLAREFDIKVIHDFAYADLVFDGYQAPSILQVPGAKDVAVEIYSLSKSYSMPGWRVGFMVGNRELIAALTKIKSYLDYGQFAPIQIAATVALDGPQHYVKEIVEIYKHRRDILCDGLNRIGWAVEKPKATMFVWAKIPEAFREKKSLEFAKILLKEAKVTVSPGVGFGDAGDDYVRFALVENEKRTRQAVAGIKKALHEK